mmetsp:Transcript_24261/g.68829  ORF Transcript_24261/g.68829 Transcript_24261/m.68829 type:complete len:1095 (-) Transcript_24261:91-3375(-)
MLPLLEEFCQKGSAFTDNASHFGIFSGINSTWEQQNIVEHTRNVTLTYREIDFAKIVLMMQINGGLAVFQLVLFWILLRCFPGVFAPKLDKSEVPKWPLGWVCKVWTETQMGKGKSARTIARRLNNLDGAVMVRYCILGFKFSTAASLVACFLMPWYHQFECDIHTHFECLTTGQGYSYYNLSQLQNLMDTERMWSGFLPAIVCAYFLVLLFVHFSMDEWRNFDIMRKEHLSRLACGHMEDDRPGAAQAQRSIMIEVVPLPYRAVSGEAVKAFFHKLFPYPGVHSAVVQPETGEFHGKVDAVLLSEGRRTLRSLRKALAPQLQQAQKEQEIRAEIFAEMSEEIPKDPSHRLSEDELGTVGPKPDISSPTSQASGLSQRPQFRRQVTLDMAIAAASAGRGTHTHEGAWAQLSSLPRVPSLGLQHTLAVPRQQTLSAPRRRHSSGGSLRRKRHRSASSVRRVRSDSASSIASLGSAGGGGTPTSAGGGPSPLQRGPSRISEVCEGDTGSGDAGDGDEGHGELERCVVKEEEGSASKAPAPDCQRRRWEEIAKTGAEVAGGAGDVAGAVYGHGRNVAEGLFDRARQAAMMMQDIADIGGGGVEVGSSTAFVTFHTVSDRVAAEQMVLCQSDISALELKPWWVQAAPEAGDINWVNASAPNAQQWTRQLFVRVLLVFAMLFWVIPIGLIQLWTNLDVLQTKFHWIAKLQEDAMGRVLYTLLTNYLPVLAQMGLLYLLPVLLEIMGTRVEGVKSKSKVQIQCVGRYLAFLMVTIYCTIVGSSLLKSMCQALSQPSKVFDILQAEVPSVACYFITYVLARAGLSAPMLLLFSVLSVWEPRDKYGRLIIRPNYAMEASQLVLVLVLGMTYCIIAPMVSFACMAYFALTTLVYSWLFLYVYTPEYDCHGKMWPQLFKGTLVGLLVGVLSLAGVASAYVGPTSGCFAGCFCLASLIMWLFPFFEVLYARPSNFIPLEVAREIDNVCAGNVEHLFCSDYYLDPVITGKSQGLRSVDGSSGCCCCCGSGPREVLVSDDGSAHEDADLNYRPALCEASEGSSIGSEESGEESPQDTSTASSSDVEAEAGPKRPPVKHNRLKFWSST